jgi:hypothetical protein
MADKHDCNKPDLTLVPRGMVVAIARALEFGAGKYGRGAYTQPPLVERNRYLAAALRHIFADLDGERFDEESGLPHLFHAAGALAMLLSRKDEHT